MQSHEPPYEIKPGLNKYYEYNVEQDKKQFKFINVIKRKIINKKKKNYTKQNIMVNGI